MSWRLHGQNTIHADTVRVNTDSIIIYSDSVFIPEHDTVLIIDNTVKYKVRNNPYKNSHDFSDSLYYKSRNSKIARELYDLLISYKPPRKNRGKGQHTKSRSEFEKFDGAVIDEIHFVKVDVLEGSVDDTSRDARTTFARILNKTHINTRDWVLQKYMILEPGETINPAILADNERVIRELPGVEDARILVIPDSLQPGKVGLIVVTQDIFPLGVAGSASSLKKYEASLSNNNTFGLALELGGRIRYEAEHRIPWGYELNGAYRNLLGTFINSRLALIDVFGTRRFDVSLSRGFITPRTKYGGGLNAGRIMQNYDVKTTDTTFSDHFESNYQDIWLGRAFLPGGKNSRFNVILSARYERKKFMRRPFVSADSNFTFHNKEIYYGKIGLSHINYYKTTLIRSFGNTEDIPYGYTGGFTVAYMNGEYLGRLYLGANAGWGKYIELFGYLRANVIAGGFYRSAALSQGIVETNLFYYTPLIYQNRYSSRIFLDVNYRQAITKDINTTFDFGENIRNLDQGAIAGKSTLSVNFEMVYFTPWYFYGFRFAPFVFADLGLISESRNVFFNYKFYSAPGIGFRIRNESLAFKNIIISFGLLPQAPAGDKSYFYNFRSGESPLVSLLNVQKPYILRRDLVFPY